jgi:hypothetical protein
MMKNNAWLRGSGTGLAAIIKAGARIGFLTDRQEGIYLSPEGPEKSGYVWKRVPLRGKQRD